MKLLHTSDWHLGRTIYGRRCTTEYRAFLQWLIEQIKHHKIDCLLVAGDIFDTSTPSNAIQHLYYSFLHTVSQSCCRHVVLIGGNHDSPSLLNAPKDLLRHLNVSVIGNAQESVEDEVLTLFDGQGNPEIIVCAIPYLRDSEIRKSQPGESIEDKAKQLLEGIEKHYLEASEIAFSRRNNYAEDIPLIAMGHLFAAGGKIDSPDEIRDLYIGSLAHININRLPDIFDYLALGHLHQRQVLDSKINAWYSGSPLQFSFSRRQQSKSVNIVDIGSDHCHIDHLEVPEFIKLASISGTKEVIIDQLRILSEIGSATLVEIEFDSRETAHLQFEVDETIKHSSVEVLRMIDLARRHSSPELQEENVLLEDMNSLDVFKRCLDEHGINEEERPLLEHCYKEILVLVEDTGDDSEEDQ